jgi:hypothetical protein
MKSQSASRRKKIISQLSSKYFNGNCPFKEAVQKPLYKFLIGGEKEIIEYGFLLKSILKEFLNNPDFQSQVMSNGLTEDCYETTVMLNNLISLMDDLSESEEQLVILQKITSIEKGAYTELGLDSIEKQFLN